jgi:hypothetical protein
MTTRSLLIATVLIAATIPAMAQTPAPRAPRAATPAAEAQAPPPPPPAPPVAGGTLLSARRNAQPVNVKIEFTLTDQRAGSPAVTRTLSVIVADAHTGQIRSQSDMLLTGSVPLNVDATPELLADGKVRVGFSLQYDWAIPRDSEGKTPTGTVMRTTMHDSVSLILESGKPMIAAQSADPIGDRKVTVEVKATVLK